MATKVDLLVRLNSEVCNVIRFIVICFWKVVDYCIGRMIFKPSFEVNDELLKRVKYIKISEGGDTVTIDPRYYIGHPAVVRQLKDFKN